jgi:hypothetical protein
MTMCAKKTDLYYFLLIVLFVLPGCLTLPDANERKSTAQQLAAAHGWVFKNWHTSDFMLAGFAPPKLSSFTLRIYIEGDGMAWITSRKPSKNPTPENPVALQLALADDSASVYLARPCQYILPLDNCSKHYWTSGRYAEEVVAAISEAVSLIKQEYGAKRIELFGYSGGGTIAALVAARRNDVTRLVTVAGNMDHAFWTDYHKVSPLKNSLNPPDFAQQLFSISQTHFVGSEDGNVPVNVIHAYQRHLPATNNVNVHVISDYDHNCCWVENWSKLLNRL